MNWLTTREKYSGEWLSDQQHGFGCHILLDNLGEEKFLRNHYEGQFASGQRSGVGVFYYANGA